LLLVKFPYRVVGGFLDEHQSLLVVRPNQRVNVLKGREIDQKYSKFEKYLKTYKQT
jgi:hypothetical protein